MKRATRKKPVILGLTGSIGMGKSTVARMLGRLGARVYSADAAVHEALARGGAGVKRVASLFPESLKNGAIDRKILGRLVFNDAARLRRLEKILHPLAQKAEQDFIRAAAKDGVPVVVLEIPLLFETGAAGRCDAVICVFATAAVQKTRVLARAGITLARFKAIRAQQMADAEKRRRADYVIRTDCPLDETRRQAKMIWHKVLLAKG